MSSSTLSAESAGDSLSSSSVPPAHTPPTPNKNKSIFKKRKPHRVYKKCQLGKFIGYKINIQSQLYLGKIVKNDQKSKWSKYCFQVGLQHLCPFHTPSTMWSGMP